MAGCCFRARPCTRCVAVVLRYRLPLCTPPEPRYPWPAARDDLLAAVAYMQSQAAQTRWNIAPGKLGILGFSAGAHLAAQAAYAAGVCALVLVYPPLTDADGVGTLDAVRAAHQRTPGVHSSTVGASTGMRANAAMDAATATPTAAQDAAPTLPACYVVASTVDRVCPPNTHADVLVAELNQLGARTVVYQRQRLGAHGFGCVRKWTAKCAVWLRAELGVPDGDAAMHRTGHTTAASAVVGLEHDPNEVNIIELRTEHAGIGIGERADQPASVRGCITARRQGRAPRVFLDLQVGRERLQLVAETSELDPGIKPGVAVACTGYPGRMPGRGAFALFCSPGDIKVTAPPSSAVAGVGAGGVASTSARAHSAGVVQLSQASLPRFHMSPSTTGWQSALGKLYIGAFNSMAWGGGLPLPDAPEHPARASGGKRCWLLPATDVVAVGIARWRKQLEAKGWRVLTCDEMVISRLSNKVAFRDHAHKLGLLEHLPAHYMSPEEATFPCIMKGAEGNHGQNVNIVRSLELLQLKTEVNWGSGQELLQELIPGRVELSTSVLVKEGKIFDAVCTEYTYDRDEYVWPHVTELKHKRVSHDVIPREHHGVMEALLVGYTGICNFNYKLRPGGQLALFEVNTRVGGDLGEDVPRWRARTFLEKLDSSC